MRDPNRIDEINGLFLKIWKCVPDWRFGQLLSNLMGYIYTQTGFDPFYVEDDDKLKNILLEYAKAYGSERKEV